MPLAQFLELLVAGPLAIALGLRFRLGPVEATHSTVLSLVVVGLFFFVLVATGLTEV